MKYFEVCLERDKSGFLDDKYGGNAYKEFLDKDGYPFLSPKLEWEDVLGAESYALELIDYDACYVSGKIFVHWVVGNIAQNYLQEDASRKNSEISQGVNSVTQGFWLSRLDNASKKESNLATSNYIGPMPPDKDHFYLFQVYALDIERLKLKSPFFINDLHDAMRGHIIGIGRTEFKYKRYEKKSI